MRAYNNDYVCLLPLETVGEEGVGIFGVELESFPEVRPAHWARRKAEAASVFGFIAAAALEEEQGGEEEEEEEAEEER